MAKIVLFAIGCAMLIGIGSGIKCYLCDDYDNNNCEGQHWPILKNCRFSCASYQAEMQQPARLSLLDKNISRHHRGCGVYEGCKRLKEDFHKAFEIVYDTHCEECTTDLCNNRANHPGYKYDLTYRGSY